MTNKEFYEELEEDIKSAYTGDLSISKSEELAAKFLHAQMLVSAEIRSASLDAKMRKVGVKSSCASAYLEIINKADKKPTENMLEALVDANEEILTMRQKLAESEVEYEELDRYLSIFKEAHIYFRGVSKGRLD